MSNLVQKEKVPWRPMPYMQDYLDELAAMLRSVDYIRKVKVALSYFAMFLKEEGVIDPDDIERGHVIRFQAWVNEQSWKPTYSHQTLVYVRGWLNWMEKVEYIENNPWRRIKLKGYHKKPRPLMSDELDLLFETHRKQMFSMPAFFWHRRELVLTLLYGWGLRIHELAELNVASMDVRQDFVSVRNKGGRTKSLPYTEPMKEVTTRWLRVRSQFAKPGEDALLIDKTGQRLSIESIRKTIADLGKAAGVEVNPHRLRDTFGTDAINSDVEVERIAKMMGHSNTSMTMAYSQLHDRKLLESHERFMTPQLNRLLGRRTNG